MDENVRADSDDPPLSNDSDTKLTLAGESQSAEFSEKTDLNPASSSQSVSNDDCAGKDMLFSEQGELRFSRTSTDITCPSSDEERPRTFSELREIFSKGNNGQVRPDTRDLDLTPVKEKQNVDLKPDKLEAVNINNSNNLLLSGLQSNFEADCSSIINTPGNLRTSKSISFGIDLDNCVTRDCASLEMPYNASLENGDDAMQCNGSNERASLGDVDKDVSEIFKNEEDTFVKGSITDVPKKNQSWEISLGDENTSNHPSKRRMFDKKFGARLKKSSPEQVVSSKTVADQAVTSSSQVSPRSFSFEITFENRNSNKKPSPRKVSAKNQTQRSKASHDIMRLDEGVIDSLPEKDSKIIQTESVIGASPSNTLRDRETSTSSNSFSESETYAHYPSVDALPEKERDVGTSNLSTCGISFDIRFDDNTPFPRTRLAPKHIRLHMVKTNRRKSPKKAVNSVPSRNDEKEKPVLAKRDTYTLDEVSQTLHKACEKGQTLEEALDDLSRSHDQLNNVDTSKPMDRAEPDTKISKRGTYSLDEVSKCLVDAATNGQTVTQALDVLAHSEERKKSAKGVKQDLDSKRGTYDLDDVSVAIDNKKSNGSSLEQALEQLLDEVESAIRTPASIPTLNRGTYDLEEVSKAVDNLSEFGVSAEESLSKISNHMAAKSSSQQDKNSTANQDVFGNESYSDKRGTYSLDDVASRLDSASNNAVSVIDTLSDISRSEFKDSGNECGARNTYTLDEVAQSLEMAKTKGIPIVEALSNISNTDGHSTPVSRRTYSLDEVAESLESARSKGLPIVMALENLVTHGGGSLRAPTEVAVHRRQGKLTNRKTYALASPLETIGEDNQLRLFDGTSRKLLPSVKDPVFGLHNQIKDGKENESSSGTHVMQTLDLLTSACEALLKSPPRPTNDGIEEQSQADIAIDRDFKSEGSGRRTYSLDDVSENLKTAEDKGIPVVEALETLTTMQTKKHFRIPRAIRKAASKSDSNIHMSNAKEDSSRQTYSLENVSNSVEAAKAKGIPVIAALDELTESLAKFSATGAQSMKNGKKPIRKPDRPSIRKREAARLERSGVRSEVNVDIERSTGTLFPISYPPAMRNSYSLDDVASAFEMAYKTGASFQEFLDDKTAISHPDTENEPGKAGSAAFKGGSQDNDRDFQEHQFVKSNSATSLSRNNDCAAIAVLPLSSSDSQIVPDQRKDSTSSEGSISYSSSAGSDLSLTKESSTEDIRGDTPIRKLRKCSNGPFQLRRSRRNSPAYLQKQKGTSSLSQGKSKQSKAESLEKDTCVTKRGTYELRIVSEELDRLQDQGSPIVKSLDTLATRVSDNTALHSQHETCTIEDLRQPLDQARINERSVGKELNANNKENKSKDVSNEKHVTDNSSNQQEDLIDSRFQNDNSRESTPKRSTYIVEDDTKCVGSTTHVTVADQRDQSESSNPCLSESRNTFKLDHVQHSIEDAHKRGVPVVDVLDKLSKIEVSRDKERRKHLKTKLKSFAKSQTKSKDQNEFFIEYFPSKTVDSTRLNLENGKAANLSNLEYVESKHQPEVISKEQENEANANECIQTSAVESHARKPFDDKACSPGSISNDNETESVVIEGQSSLPPSKPRWQRTGSYVEALDSYEKIVHAPEGNSKELENNAHLKDTGNEATTRSRPTWRTSESVLGQILTLMDNAEEKGLSIADALEQAAEMSEKEGEIDESKDDGIEGDTTNPQHLALLSLHFEEKRRQIEAERQRSHEQWEEERRKIGETTFWYTIGRAQGNDKDTGKILPRHENEPFSPGQPTPPIGRSTPFEGTSPLQNKPVHQSPIGDEYQSTLNHTTIGHGYHQTFVHRPGHQPTAQSPVIPHTGFQFPSTHSPTYPPVSSSDYHGNQHAVRTEEQEYETRQFLLSEYAVQQDVSSVPSSQNEPSKSPLRKCWEVNPPAATAVFAASSTEGVALHVEEAQGEDSGNQFEDPNDAHNKKGVAMFIGDETEVKQEENLQGLTPEQQRKRDRFLKNRQKKHEEEKIRRDAEHEKKRLRELKQKEIEEQKRLEDEQKREEQRRLKQTRERMAASNGETTSRPVANLPEDNSGFNEFSGPRCYVKPSGKSNRKLITNAISHVCLSGTVNKENKEKCLQAIADSPGFHFIVLFKDGLKFRGLYMLNPETEQAFKVFGIGPKIITSKMVDCVYKYSSGGKEFTKIPSKTLSISVDGVAILKTYWQSNKHNVASKTQSNLKRPPRPPQR